MPRFFLSPDTLAGPFAVLTGENAVHAKVLRLKAGDAVTLCDGLGTDFSGVISDVSPGQISVVIQKAFPCPAESALCCAVYMAYAKQDKLEHVVQKATELGRGGDRRVSFGPLCVPSGCKIAGKKNRAMAKNCIRRRRAVRPRPDSTGAFRSNL